MATKFCDSLPPSGTNGVAWTIAPWRDPIAVHPGPQHQGFFLDESLRLVGIFGDFGYPAQLNLSGTDLGIKNILNTLTCNLRAKTFEKLPRTEIPVTVIFYSDTGDETNRQLTISLMACLKKDLTENPEFELQSRQYRGLCPKCGESGRLDPCGGANCSAHGFYQLMIVPEPKGSPPPVLNNPFWLEDPECTPWTNRKLIGFVSTPSPMLGNP